MNNKNKMISDLLIILTLLWIVIYLHLHSLFICFIFLLIYILLVCFSKKIYLILSIIPILPHVIEDIFSYYSLFKVAPKIQFNVTPQNYQVVNYIVKMHKSSRSHLYLVESGKKRFLLRSYNKKNYFVKYRGYLYQPNPKYEFFIDKHTTQEEKVHSVRAIVYNKIIEKPVLIAIPYILPILLGIKEGDFTLFKKTGTWHLLCVGGLHLHFLQSLIIFMSRCFLGMNPNKIYPFFYILEMMILWFFAYLSGYQIPALRSVIMLSIDLMSRIWHFSIPLELRYYFTFLLLLIYNMEYIFDLGFQMSFLAVYMIISFSKVFKYKKQFSSPLKNSLINSFIINILISIGVLLHSFLLHGNINLLSPILNLVTIPIFLLCLMCTPLFFLYGPLSFIGIYLFKLLTWILFYGDRYGIFIYYTIKKPEFIYYLVPYIIMMMICKYSIEYIVAYRKNRLQLITD